VYPKTAGRPAQLDYSEPTCQLNVEVPVTLKRSLVERADRANGLLMDEVVIALTAHVERDESQLPQLLDSGGFGLR
jgi:hypothetical protein